MHGVARGKKFKFFLKYLKKIRQKTELFLKNKFFKNIFWPLLSVHKIFHIFIYIYTKVLFYYIDMNKSSNISKNTGTTS